ncbi:TIGR04219 family outer membrane beta-barrel protein [Aquisalimonas asiatica]|uniref:Outer membrane protein n=1 Tax=Aquisalimonas asiatica TaxID=406100 RepID=A0A1H8UAL3_9GAMM|nr:TIGR04219 family outer membrane beta-barrel protein [Aquisalimonas asiatica]SEP00241.1 outer membrane protein [Aquisalimonas asiatica]
MRVVQQGVLVAVLMALPLSAKAGLTGASVGVGIWNQSPSGHVQSDGNRVDVEDDLDMDSELGYFVWADLRHPVPLLPRLKLQHTPVNLEGEGDSEFEFAGETFASDNESEITLDQTDFIIYWSPWSLFVDLDVGLNVKYIDGEVEVEDSTTGDRERVAFDGPLPLLYVRTEARLPGTGLFGGGEVSYLSFDGHRIVDLALRAGYRTGIGLASVAVEGGWKHQNIRLDDFDDMDADLTIEGPYMGVSARF